MVCVDCSNGWYCIEVEKGGEMAKVTLVRENINILKINSKIYWLNKQPIPDGHSLSVDDWTEITLTSGNLSNTPLSAGIYWYHHIGPPPPPQNFNVDFVGQHIFAESMIILEWGAPTAADWGKPTETLTGYKIETTNSTNGVGWVVFVELYDTTIERYEFAVGDFALLDKYFFRITAIYSLRGSIAIDDTTGIVIDAIPNDVSNVVWDVIESGGALKMDSSWENGVSSGGSEIIEYHFEKSDDDGATWTKFMDVSRNATFDTTGGTTTTLQNIKFDELTWETGYVVRIKARNSQFTSGGSGKSNRIWYGPNTPPDDVSNVVVGWDVSNINVAWENGVSSGGSEIIEYHFEKSDDDGATWTKFMDVSRNTTFDTTGGTTTTLQNIKFEDLTWETGYVFRIKARNSQGRSGSSSSNSIWYGPVPDVTTFVATPGNNFVYLQWEEPNTTFFVWGTSYKIEQSVDAGVTWAVSETENTPHTITDLNNGQVIIFKITAKNALGEGNPSEQISVVVGPQPDSIATVVNVGNGTPIRFIIQGASGEWLNLSNNVSTIAEKEIFEHYSSYGPTWFGIEGGIIIEAFEYWGDNEWLITPSVNLTKLPVSEWRNILHADGEYGVNWGGSKMGFEEN